MICKICGKELSGKGLGSHLTTHKISAKDYYDKYLKQPNEGICPVCGKETPFIKISKGYQKHCCNKCTQKDPKIREKVNKTRLEKYGVTNFFQNKSIHEKAEKNAHSEEANKKKIETSQKHYGVDNPAQSEVVQSKIQQTNLERYGSRAYNHTKGRQTMKEKYGYEHALQVPEIKAKQEQTCMEKFGVCNAYASNEIRKKIEQHNIEKYGVPNPYQATEVQSKIRQTMLDRYGVEYALQSDEIKEKTKQTNLEKYNCEYPYQNDDIKQKLKENRILKMEEFMTLNHCVPVQHLLKIYGTGWYQSSYFKDLEILMYNGIAYVKEEDIPKIKEYASVIHKSNYENELYQLFRSLDIASIKPHDRTVIKPLELDIYVESLNLAIEFNGTYWHSIEADTPKDYHLKKSLMCRDKGIRLIHIYEFEDFEKQKQLLKNLILGQDNYPKEDFNKNNLIINIPVPTIIYQNDYTIYGAGPLY